MLRTTDVAVDDATHVGEPRFDSPDDLLGLNGAFVGDAVVVSTNEILGDAV
jgi:hypothetical protein